MKLSENPVLRWFFPPLVFLLLTALYFPEAVSKVYIDLGDGWSQFYGRIAFFKDSLNRCVFPLWNPFVLCGTPNGLDPHSSYTLTHFLASFLSLPHAWNGSFMISAFLSGYFVFLSLEKHFGVRRDAALLGGFINLTLCVNVPMENPTFFLPALFFLATQWLRSGRFVWAFFLAIINAWYFLSSNPQFVIYSSIFLFVYILIFRCRQDPRRSWIFHAMVAAVPFLVTVGLACFQLARVFQLLADSTRQRAVGDIFNILLPTDLIGMFVPDHYYNSIDSSLNFLPAAMQKGLVQKFLPSVRLRFLAAPYAGILPLFLVLTLFLKEKLSSAEKFLACAVIVILIYLIFNPLFFFVRCIPVIKDLPMINRIYLIYGFAISMLAGFAFDSIGNCREKTEKVWRALKVVVLILGAIVLLRVLIWWGISRWQDLLTAFSLEHILPVVLQQKFYLASTDFYHDRILQIIVFMKHWASPFNLVYANPLLILAISLAGFSFFLRWWVSRTVLCLLFFGVIFLDSFFNLRPKTAYSAESLSPLKQEADWILRDRGLFRVLPLQPAIDPSHPPLIDTRLLDTRTITLWPETSLLYLLQTPEGFRSMIKKRYVDFFELLSMKPVEYWRLGEINKIDDYFADMANVRYVIAPETATLPQYALVHESGKFRIFENQDAMARAYIVHRAEVFSGGLAVLDRLRKKSLNFRGEVLLEDPDLASGPWVAADVSASGMDSIRIAGYDANHLTVDVALASDGFLVVTDSFDPGWRAYIDGKETAIRRANYIFKAVKVPKGSHRIQFSYDPSVMRKGLIVAAMVFFLGVIISVLDLHRKKGIKQ